MTDTDEYLDRTRAALGRFWEKTAKEQEAERRRACGETKPRTQEHARLKRAVVDAVNASGLAWAAVNEVGVGRRVNSDARITYGLGTGSYDVVGYTFGNGRMFFLEVKIPPDTLRDSQKKFRDRHAGRGAHLAVVLSVVDAIDEVKVCAGQE